MRRLAPVVLFVLAIVPVFGQGMIIPDRWFDGDLVPVPPGTLPLIAERLKVDANIREFAATTTVEQTFYNQYRHRIEGTFLFPLPEGAGVTDFAMTIDGKEVGAELLDARKAREIYEGIVRRQRDPALLEYLGRDLFRARIFPIEGQERKRIRIEYTQAVPGDNGLGRFVFPLRNRAFHTPRPPVRPPHPIPFRDNERVAPAPPAPDSPERVDVVSLSARIESRVGIKSVYSPTHDIDLHREGEHVVKVGFEGTGGASQDDFILYYQLTDAAFGLNLLAHRDSSDEEGTFMLLIAPKSEVREAEIAAKDIVFVFDTSGSMSGEKIQQAKKALVYCLRNLNPGDRFNVLTFSTAVTALEEQLVVATQDSLDEAIKFVGEVRARGGTNISEALTTALAMLPKDDARPSMVLFLTDGQPTVGETRPARILEAVGERNKADARLFVFGVGDDVNTMLLDRLSLDNRGVSSYVRPNEDIEAEVGGLYDKIASPVLSDLRLDIDGVKVEDLHPVTLPDLFRGSQLTVFGRYRGEGPATIRLRGTMRGEEQTYSYSADFPRRAREHAFVPRLWATRKVGYLLEQLRLNGHSQELVDEVVRLATRYGILTPYTSYLVLEPGMTAETEAIAAVRRGTVAPAPGMPGRPADGTMAGGAPGPQGPAGPAGESGAGAVLRSEEERKLREAHRSEPPVGVAVESVGGRTFYLIDGVWVDSTYPAEPDPARVITVKYGSDAYFDLLTLRDEMKDILALGTAVKVNLPGALLVIADDGAEQLTDAQREALRK